MDGYNQFLGQIRMNKLSYGKQYNDLYYVLINRIEEYPTDIVPGILNEIVFAILEDFPDIFWFEGKWKIGINAEQKRCFVPIYKLGQDDIEQARKNINNIVKL